MALFINLQEKNESIQRERIGKIIKRVVEKTPERTDSI